MKETTAASLGVLVICYAHLQTWNETTPLQGLTRNSTRSTIQRIAIAAVEKESPGGAIKKVVTASAFQRQLRAKM